MAGRWATAAGELHVPAAPTASGLPSQASVAAVNVAHADVTAFTAGLANRVQAHSRRVAEAGRRYTSNEADSADAMAAVAAVAGFPDLSQVLVWPTQHLTDAARHWAAVGERSYSVIHQVWRDGLSSDWRGRAADALHAATHDDVGKTSGVADQLRVAAGVARSGASELVAARSRVRYAVEDAMRSGFDVYEDMSVADRSTGGSAAQRAARQAQAQAFAGDIRRRAAELVALDQQVAGRVTAATAGIRDTFPQTRIPMRLSASRNSKRSITTPSKKIHRPTDPIQSTRWWPRQPISTATMSCCGGVTTTQKKE